MADSVLALVLLAELGGCLAAWYRLQPTDLAFGEALCRALALTLAGFGLAIQLLFVLHLARFPWLLDAAVGGLWLAAFRCGRRPFLAETRAALAAARRFPCAWLLGAAFAGLAVTVWVAPPTNWDAMTYNLSRVLVMMRENTLAPDHVANFRQFAFSPGFDLLHWFFLRYGTDRAIAAFSLLAYATIVSGAYALARRQGEVPFALRVTLVVASLKLLPLEAVSTKNDIGAAAMAVACLVAAARLLDRPGLGALGFLLACAFYGLSTKSHFALFGGPFTALVLWARCGELLAALAGGWRRQRGRLAAAALALGATLALCLASQWHNLARYGHPFGPPEEVARHENADGLTGAAANLARYALDVADVPGPWWYAARQRLHERLLGPGRGPGATMAFHAAAYAVGNELREDAAWFGLLGGLLLVPCVVAGLFRRNDTLCRLSALSLVAFAALVCLKITWFSFNNRFFSLFFAASAPCLIAARGVWHDRRWLRLPVMAVATLTLLAATLANQDRPLVGASLLPSADPPFEVSILDRPGGRRGAYAAFFDGPLLLDYLTGGLFPGGRGLLVADTDSVVYPILFYARAQDWLLASRQAPLVPVDGTEADIRDCAALKALTRRFDVTVVMEEPAALACLAGEKPVMTTRAPWGDVLVFTAGKNAVGSGVGATWPGAPRRPD
ncbi:MAG: hypothetical protein ACP59X_07535 [Solidesulfovibrio sp. DCME]|uniref:hypothetical protein n=1 Tax=Solidesulfovibrio sp. DCME TaxID=3447380 RepID=UPI003D126F49